MPKDYDLLLLGNYCQDLVFADLDRLPELGIEVVAGKFAMLPGGAYNTAVAMHRLGIRVAWASDFGNDEYSQYTLDHLREEGLDSTYFYHHERPLRNITVVATYPQDRAFLAYYDPEPPIPAGLKALPGVRAKLVYLTGIYHGPAFQAGLTIIRAKKMKLVMDGNCDHTDRLSDPTVRKSIAAADIFMPNSAEVRQLTGESELKAGMDRLAELSPLLVVKDGANGAYACTGGETVHVPAIPVEPVDTTGAGDCFNAGFMRAYLQGRSLVECLRWGNIVGGLSTLALGGTGKIIREKDVIERLEEL